MKKILLLTLAALMILLTACGTIETPKETTGKTQNTTKSPETTKPSETTKKPEATTAPPETTEEPVEINYEIGTVEDLLAFMKSPDLEGDYILTNDIVFNDTTDISAWATIEPTNVWEPVGNIYAPFTGTFNGQGYKISGLYVKVYKYAGFFGAINDATVENLIIGEGYMFATDAVAGAISAYYGGSSVVRGCVNYATVTADSYAGGILGKFSVSTGVDMKVELCVNYGKVIGTLTKSTGYIGGIVGICVGMDIDRCANFGDISVGVGISTQGAIIGGITGLMGSSQGYAESITNCYNAGTITSTQLVGNAATGGIVGRMHTSNGEVSNCYNIGEIYVGGKDVQMRAYLAANSKENLDYTKNLYNSGKMYLIDTTEELLPTFTEKGLKGPVETGNGAVLYMEFDSNIWVDSVYGTPILKDIDESYQIFGS